MKKLLLPLILFLTFVSASAQDMKQARTIMQQVQAAPVLPNFAIREARISAFAMRETDDMRLPWYDSPTVQRWGCRAVTPWQPQD